MFRGQTATSNLRNSTCWHAKVQSMGRVVGIIRPMAAGLKHVGLLSCLLAIWGCSPQRLVAIDSANASGGNSGTGGKSGNGGNGGSTSNTGGPGCIGVGKTCDFADSLHPCCEGAYCTWGKCTPPDAGYPVGLGQPCNEPTTSCVSGLRCQTIGSQKLCVNLATASDGWVCSLSSDCGSLNCDGNHCAASAPCTVTGARCTAGYQCCSNQCGSDGYCNDGNGNCAVYGDGCESDANCCTRPPGINSCVKVGDTSRCLAPACRHSGDICTTNDQCCSNACYSSQCQDMGFCSTKGQSCSTGSECCSRACIQEGASFQWSCAKLDGCQPQDAYCTKDEDCCSNDCSNSQCIPNTNNSCLNDGEFCSIACCSNHPCGYDWYGVSRCSSLPSGGCLQAGYACAYGTQCCNGGRCEQDSNGQFICKGN
jgi:hypothetical protein